MGASPVLKSGHEADFKPDLLKFENRFRNKLSGLKPVLENKIRI